MECYFWCGLGSKQFCLSTEMASYAWHGNLYPCLCEWYRWGSEWRGMSSNLLLLACKLITTDYIYIWTLRPKGVFKLNCDGASLQSDLVVACDGVIRDNHGRFIQDFSQRSNRTLFACKCRIMVCVSWQTVNLKRLLWNLIGLISFRRVVKILIRVLEYRGGPEIA